VLIACPLDDDFEDSQLADPAAGFRMSGHRLTVIGLEGGREVPGTRGQVRARTDSGIGDVDPADSGALFLPGGSSPDHLRADRRCVAIAGQMVDAERPVLAICHGPQLLLTADAVRGRRTTAWKTVKGDLRHAGAVVVDEKVVVDGNLVPSRQPSDLPDFIRESLVVLGAGAAPPSAAGPTPDRLVPS